MGKGQLEHQEQCAVFTWAQGTKHRPGAVLRWPELELLHAIPNAAPRTDRGRIWMQREGLRSGVPDVCLPVPRKLFHGLYIELKAGKNKPTDNQNWWLKNLKAQGYYTAVCVGAKETIDLLEWYLKLEKSVPFMLRSRKG